MKKIDTYTMVMIALVTAVLCVISPFSVPLPFSPVPVSLSILAIYLGLYAIGWKKGLVACLLYILIGFVGVPVFSGFSGGPAKLFGPTGGYIFGYFFICLIAGMAFEKTNKLWIHVIGMLVGVTVCYAFGTIWFLQVMEGYDLAKAMAVCVIPFIPADIVKIVIAVIVGPVIKKQVAKLK